MNIKTDKFYQVKNLLQCPICGKKIRFHAGGLVCKKEHRFDISAKGYVNLLLAGKTLKGYDKAFFEGRRRFFDAGFYDHIAQAVCEAAEAKSGGLILDAGCGEGFYSAMLEDSVEAAEGQLLAFDIASDAIKIAAKRDERVKWMVADITNIPLRAETVDCILDVFTPANYKEFERILRPDGILVKVVPGPAHLKELRQAAGNLLRNQEYSNEEVLAYFSDHFHMQSQRLVSKTLPISEQALIDLVQMTPLFFDVDKSALDLSGVREITIEGEVLVGKSAR